MSTRRASLESSRQFPRYHKYTLGSELRRQAMNVKQLIIAPPETGYRSAI